MKLFRGMALSFLVVLVSLALVQPASAQNTNKGSSGIGIGVEGMVYFPNISNISSNFDTKTGSGFGLWIGGNKNGLIGFTGEFIYKTAKIESTDGLSSARRHALEIPELLHINFGSRNKNGVSGYILGGSVFTIVLNDTLSGGLSGANFNSADYGLMAGAGIEFFRIGIEGRGNWGFNSISADGGGAFSDSKTYSFELLGKFRFN